MHRACASLNFLAVSIGGFGKGLEFSGRGGTERRRKRLAEIKRQPASSLNFRPANNSAGPKSASTRRVGETLSASRDANKSCNAPLPVIKSPRSIKSGRYKQPTPFSLPCHLTRTCISLCLLSLRSSALMVSLRFFLNWQIEDSVLVTKC